jgi:DNA-directed RNA polymerase subunit RPC12/RpoP
MGHKGIICPKCGHRSTDEGTDFGFTYVTTVWASRNIIGFTPDGKLRVDGMYQETGDDTKDRLTCHKCSHEFPLIPEVYDNIEWE